MKNMRCLCQIALAATVAAAIVSSCKTELYDEEKYTEYIKYMSPVDSVDQQHQWQLTTDYLLTLTANAGSGMERVQVYTANPLTDTSAELMNQQSISDGGTVQLTVSAPTILQTMYAALTDADGRGYVKAFSTGQTEVDFSGATEGRLLQGLQPQAFTYLYEEKLPEVDDYDYNDLVLRITTERTGVREVTVGVTIMAVGASRQLAGAIRLLGYQYADIDSITTATGSTFNEGVPQGSMFVFDKIDNLLEGRNGEAVMNLFIDAHWAMGFNLGADYGLFVRKKYNVSNYNDEQFQLKATRTQNYVIHFKSEAGLNNFTLNSLDPFIITEYNSGRWETHMDHLRSAQVLFEYKVSDIKDLPWALKIPMRNFRYPLEGCEIGFKKRTETGTVAMFGAYMTAGHSFGEWAEDHTRFLDWYLYPDAMQVK